MTIVFDKSATLAGTDDGDGNSNLNIRQRVPKATLSAASGTTCQLTLLFGTACPASLAIDTMYFGQSDQGANSIKFAVAANQAQVKFSGAATVNGGAALVVTSDTLTLPQTFDITKDYLLAFHCHSGSGVSLSIATVSGVDLWVSTAGADESSVTNPAGSYTDFPNTLGLLEKIAITAAGGGSPLRTNSSMDGLGASGGFFSNPLARSVLGWRPSIVTARRKLIVPRHAELRLAA